MTERQPGAYFLWILLLSVPIYVWGLAWPVAGLPFGLPGTVVMILLPAAVASRLTFQERGARGVWLLWRRILDVRRISRFEWLAAALLCMPGGTLAAYAAMRLLDLPLPDTGESQGLLWRAPLLMAVYFLGAIPEEIGWTGYATDPLQRRHGVVGAGLLIGAVWAVWHVVPWWLVQGHAPRWVAGMVLLTILMRVLMGWIHARGGRSLFLALLFHASLNTSYSLFPNGGSHFDPLVLAGVLLLLVPPFAFAAWAGGRRGTSGVDPST